MMRRSGTMSAGASAFATLLMSGLVKLRMAAGRRDGAVSRRTWKRRWFSIELRRGINDDSAGGQRRRGGDRHAVLEFFESAKRHGNR